jgi:isoleucyl-tRNA synthetase
MMAPVLSFTAEEIWGFLPGKREESVHLASFPNFETTRIDADLEEKYERILAIRSDVSKVLEQARTEKTIGHSLDARVELAAEGDLGAFLKSEAEQLACLFIVSQVEICDNLDSSSSGENLPGLKIRVSKADGEKCSRCWNYATTVGKSEDHPEICHRCIQAIA